MRHYTTDTTTAEPRAESYPAAEEGLAAYADASSGEVWMGHDGGPSLSAPDPTLGNRNRNVMGNWGWWFLTMYLHYKFDIYLFIYLIN